MTFRVEPSFLDGYAGQVRRAGEDATAVQNYLNGFSAGASGDGMLIALVKPSLAESLTASLAAAGKVATTLTGSASGLTEAAAWYRHTDLAAAARLDATMPSIGTCVKTSFEQQWAANPCGPSFHDSRDPSSKLTSVGEVEFSHPMAFMDYVSPSHHILEAIDKVFHKNILEEALNWFLGDWQAVARAGVAFGHAADAVQDLGYNVQGGAIALQPGWDGVAADSAYYRFTRLADGAFELSEALREIGKQYTGIAKGVYDTSEAVSGFIKGLCDAALVAGIAFVGGTATAYTGFGAVVGYGVAALEVAEMMRMWANATNAANKIYAVIQASLGLVEAQVYRMNNVMPSLGEDYRAYSHPQVPDWVGAR